MSNEPYPKGKSVVYLNSFLSDFGLPARESVTDNLDLSLIGQTQNPASVALFELSCPVFPAGRPLGLSLSCEEILALRIVDSPEKG
jgi:hypothetical protein